MLIIHRSEGLPANVPALPDAAEAVLFRLALLDPAELAIAGDVLDGMLGLTTRPVAAREG